ncbi:hypothetical protein AALO_G00175350 [Alosa alosa]|uniref:C2H2-type domain-containing protein n=1 Tax=Alosa alosa TaxID=278164 RepID=A0AAV6G7I7_9TELE|nr:zinc finger protein Xfin [Alosa alosa]KAG5271054.1 hypothetical protein AALO_G00175350 [Alosa alosa]
MFGLGETRSPDAPPVKTYQCVACSVTFHGLASLLVHQASHASEYSNPPPPPSCSSCGTVFGSRDLLKRHVCASIFPSMAPEFYKCDCGEKCTDFNNFQAHKKSHQGGSGQSHSETHQSGVSPQGLKEESSATAVTSYPVPHSLASTDVSLTSSSLNMPPNSCDSNGISIMNLNEDLATDNRIPKQNSNLFEQLEQALDPAKLNLPLANMEMPNNISPDAEVDEFAQVLKNSVTHSENTEVLQNQNQDVKPAPNKVVMKILANAYMNINKPPELKLGSDKLEGSSSDVGTPDGSDMTSSPKRQLRPSVRRPFHTFPRMVYSKHSPKKPTVSVARRYCPVVLLETRQRFVASDKDIEGNYQCGQCKRIFSDVDKLILHHALHRKERLKSCRRCKQLFISSSGAENHTCSRAPVKDLFSKGKESPSFPKLFLKAAQPSRFHCPLCNRSYTRFYSLKKHNCRFISSLTDSAQDPFGAVENDCPDMEVNGSDVDPLKYMSVGTGGQPQVKKEMLNAESVDVDKHQTEPNNENCFEVLQDPFEDGNDSDSPKESFSPHSAESTTSEPKEIVLVDDIVPTDTVEHVGTEHPDDDDDDDGICIEDQGEEREAISAVEEAEIDVLIEADEDDHKNNVLHQMLVEGSAVSKAQNKDIPSALSNAHVKRFTCGRCHKSFTRNYGLTKHLKICAVGRIRHKTQVFESKKVFDCSQCGKTFSHMDSLKIHKRSCPTGMRMQNEPSGSYNTASQENVFVLPPLTENPSKRQEPTVENSDRNWGIMSLPSVLPRRVTCECGSAFTCPRRLFEHLQMHAQESYICPHCGENLQSWMKYEAHLRSHVQYRQQSAPEEQSQPYNAASFRQQQSFVLSPQQPSTAQLSSQQPSTPAPSSCPKCFKTFKTRRSLLRHLRLSCYGEASAPKGYACSRCGMSFLSTYTLDLHMQSNTCTLSVKPMRCPVCIRWFTSVEGLKRHLITHSQDKVFSCRLCPRGFQKPEDLEVHKKMAHGVVQEEQELQSVESREEITITSNNKLFKFFRCNMCPRMYHSMRSLKDHRKKAHSLLGGGNAAQTSETLGVQNSQMNFFRCQLCQRTYHTLKSLKNHRRRVHHILAGSHVPQRADPLGAVQSSSSNIFRCQICHRAYPTQKAWRNHRRRVHRILGGGPEMQTGESFRLMHSQAPAFTCQACRRTYPTLQSLRDHRRKVHHMPGGMLDSQISNAVDAAHNSQPMVFSCHICDRSYSKLQSLKDHRRKVHRIPGGQIDVIKVE